MSERSKLIKSRQELWEQIQIVQRKLIAKYGAGYVIRAQNERHNRIARNDGLGHIDESDLAEVAV